MGFVQQPQRGARIRAALRKRHSLDQSEPFRCGELVIDYSERRVIVAGQQLKLTPTEFELLIELSANAGRVLTHDLLLQRIWGVHDAGDTRLVHAAVKRLRRKLGDDAGKPRYIFTEPRAGYRMERVEQPGDRTP